GFIGCGHFSETNRLLEQQGKSPIEWKSVCIPLD
ncbi:MAG: uracil-DNA glycosylase, partial [Aeromonas veronii]